MLSKFVKFVLLLVALLALTAALAQQRPATAESGLWTAVHESQFALRGERHIIPQRYLTYQLNLGQMTNLLATAPQEFTEQGRQTPLILPLPLPNGKLADFAVVESSIMEPELAAKFPTFKTYAGYAVENPRTTVRLDVTLHGFHAMIMGGAEGTFYIDPYSTNDTSHYIAYAKSDYERQTDFFEIGVLDEFGRDALTTNRAPAPTAPPTGPNLYTYRLAVAATGEYTIFHGGTVADGMAAIVTAVNRVNQVYERDTAIRMVLIGNNDSIVYTNAATDPYTNGSPGTMIGQNQTNLDNVIGNANYDIGHVFGTNSGGLAGLGVTCRTGQKARGVTGSSAPINDPFWIDYVAHELGHQYNALHTFNGNAGSCSGGNRSASAAYEPGSGTTIMAYAGICGAQNLQPNSDDHFHTFSIDEIVNYTRSGSGNSCAQITSTGNSTPTASAGTGGFTIPINTPFMLTGEASDVDEDDVLSYNWEQFDLGPAGAPNSPSGNAPIFRSFPSSSSPTRTFPKMADIVNNTQTIGEILPSYTRSLSFRFTVRDNNVYPSAGGVNTSLISFNVSNAAGPFLVTAPNTAVTWTGLASQNVTWNVANTNIAPVSCTAVDIFLSTDGGYTYPTTLLTNAPNNGSASITVPNINTTTARVMVKCATNIFFDISNTNFTINAVNAPVLAISKTADPAPNTAVAVGETITYTIAVTNTGTLADDVTITDPFTAPLHNPICEGVPGDLDETLNLAAGAGATFACTAEIDPTLAVELSHTADQTAVEPGTAVTYTIAVTNPNPLTLHNVVVTSTHSTSCTPALGAPFSLAPLATASFVCANVVVNGATTAAAGVTADILVANTATASAPTAVVSPVESNTVAHVVGLAASAEASVVIEADLHIHKALLVMGGNFSAGQRITYSITISNTGDLTTTATVTDVFDASFANPVCNGVAGDLQTTLALAGGETAQWVCGVDVAPLPVAVGQGVDSAEVEAGTAVTYTLTLTNPHATPLTSVTVDVPYGAQCEANPATPFTLAPLGTATFVCAEVVISETVATTATVTAYLLVENTAEVSAPEVGGGAGITSNTVTVSLALTGTQTAVVTVRPSGYAIYLPLVVR